MQPGVLKKGFVEADGYAADKQSREKTGLWELGWGITTSPSGRVVYEQLGGS